MTNPDESMPTTKPKITDKCENFRDYLKDKFAIEKFGDFICASTFSLEKFYKELEQAKANGKPVYFRIYYGCDKNGKNHTLYIAFLDENRNVIKFERLMDTPLEHDDRCPPGGTCQMDIFINQLF